MISKLTQSRLFSRKVLVSSLPTYWDQHEISSRFSQSGAISKVQLILNKLGHFSGKAIVEFESDKSAKHAINQFDNTAVDNLVCNVVPVIDKTKESSRKEKGLLARRVYLMNLPYDAHTSEIEGLVREFAPIDSVVVPRDTNGLARGYAFVYLKKASDVQKVIEFVDGRHLRSRQVRAKSSLGGKALDEALEKENAYNLKAYKSYAQKVVKTQMIQDQTDSNPISSQFERELERQTSENIPSASALKSMLNDELSTEQLEHMITVKNQQKKEWTQKQASMMKDSPNTYKMTKLSQMAEEL